MLGALGEDGGVQPGIKGWAGSECLGRGTHLTARVSPNKTPPSLCRSSRCLAENREVWTDPLLYLLESTPPQVSSKWGN